MVVGDSLFHQAGMATDAISCFAKKSEGEEKYKKENCIRILFAYVRITKWLLPEPRMADGQLCSTENLCQMSEDEGGTPGTYLGGS